MLGVSAWFSKDDEFPDFSRVVLGTDLESSPDPAFCPLDWSLASLGDDLPGPASILTQLGA